MHATKRPVLVLLFSAGKWVSWDTEKMEVLILFRDHWHCFLLRTRIRHCWAGIQLKNKLFHYERTQIIWVTSPSWWHGWLQKSSDADRIQVCPQIWQGPTCSKRVLWNCVSCGRLRARKRDMLYQCCFL